MDPSTSVSTPLAASPSPALCLTRWTEQAHSVPCPLFPLHSCGAVHHVQRLWQCRWCQQQLGPGRRQQLLLQQQPWPWRWLQFWQWQRHQRGPQLLWWQLFHHQVHHHLLQQEKLQALNPLSPEPVCSPDTRCSPCCLPPSAPLLGLRSCVLCSPLSPPSGPQYSSSECHPLTSHHGSLTFGAASCI